MTRKERKIQIGEIRHWMLTILHWGNICTRVNSKGGERGVEKEIFFFLLLIIQHFDVIFWNCQKEVQRKMDLCQDKIRLKKPLSPPPWKKGWWSPFLIDPLDPSRIRCSPLYLNALLFRVWQTLSFYLQPSIISKLMQTIGWSRNGKNRHTRTFFHLQPFKMHDFSKLS